VSPSPVTVVPTRSNVSQQLEEPIPFGKYTLYERIGRGGMADVFKGRIEGPGGFERIFVVKRILPNLSDDPAFIKMFVDEAKMSARLNHPNIVQIFELGAVEGEFFISMEHVPGHDLGETMRALWKVSGPPRPELVAYIGREICRALAYAHSITDEHGHPLHMIHRDVSPPNVMLSFEGAVKLLDFGIAKAVGDATAVNKGGSLKGKYAYMAPEQTEGEDVDHRIDIFATGIILHEVLTGRRLFKGASDVQTIERVRRCEVSRPSQLNPACPPALDAILLQALARDRKDRFQTAGEMADALEEIVHAAHFTPQRMAAAMRETFSTDGTRQNDLAVDLRKVSSTSNSLISPTTSSTGRSQTVPPITISRSGIAPSRSEPPGAADASDSILPRPLWKRVSFWAVAALCAAGFGVAVAKGVRAGGDAPVLVEVSTSTAQSRPVKKVKLRPVLIQSDPEGADIYVAGRLEALGMTPTWVSLEIDGDNPARVMIRKSGFQDKAIAIDGEKPPTAHLIPIDIPARAVGSAHESTAVATPMPPLKADGVTRRPDRSHQAANPGTSPKVHPVANTGGRQGELVDPF
jgi:serine/threonine protein kinase